MTHSISHYFVFHTLARSGAFKVSANLFQYSRRVRENFLVLEAKNLKAACFQLDFSYLIVFFFFHQVVMRAVNFYDNLSGGTVEVGDHVPYGSLASEVDSQLVPPQQGPKLPLCSGQVSSEDFSSLDCSFVHRRNLTPALPFSREGRAE